MAGYTICATGCSAISASEFRGSVRGRMIRDLSFGHRGVDLAELRNTIVHNRIRDLSYTAIGRVLSVRARNVDRDKREDFSA